MKLRQGLSPIRDMVNDSKVDREIKVTVDKRKLCGIPLQEPGVI